VNRSSTSKLGLRQLTVIALIGVMILVAKTVLRMPIKVSGHGGVLWIAALLVGRTAVNYRAAATLMGLIGGVLVAILLPSDTLMLLTVAKYVLPGIVIDVLAPSFGQRFDGVFPAMVTGAAAHASKVLVDLIEGVIAGLPGGVLFAGFTVTLLLHIAFGALGGLIAAFVLRALIRAGVPQLSDLAEPGGVE